MGIVATQPTQKFPIEEYSKNKLAELARIGLTKIYFVSAWWSLRRGAKFALIRDFDLPVEPDKDQFSITIENVQFEINFC